MDEQEIIQGLIDKNPRVESHFYNSYRPKLLLLLKGRTHNSQDAEDIIQDTFIKIWRCIHQYKGIGSFEGWVYRIAINAAHCKYRPLRYNKEIHPEILQEGSEDPVIATQLGSKDILRHVQNLPAGYKQVFELVAIEGYSHEETAVMLGIKSGTSRSQYAKARSRLKETLERS